MKAPRTGLPLSICVAAGLLFAGCGSDDDSNTDATTRAEAEAPAVDELPEWSYEGETGPEQWAGLSPAYADCAGERQSPIVVSSEGAKPGEEIVYDYSPVDDATAEDNGHSVEFGLEGGGTIEVDGERFELLQAHFHAPSEHVLDGEETALEMHLVHQSEQGDLAVLGVLFDAGAEDPGLQPYVDAVGDPGSGEAAPAGELDPGGLLSSAGANATAIAYPGSLTTPPCTENVSWMVLSKPAQASQAQLQSFLDVHDDDDRPVQPANARDPLLAPIRSRPG